jgi:hypothetical protein
MNYKYTYNLKGVNYTVVVWDQPWLGNRQITAIQKVQTATNSQGYNVTIESTTRVEQVDIRNVAMGYFGQ